ncbi:pilin [Reinekea marina]|nr:pilin [Reinekea marina]MDN3650508.1 pilin [Reinekea marina]
MALPQYQNYVARTQLARAYSELATLRAATETSLMNGITSPVLDASSIGAVKSSIATALPTLSFASIDGGYGDIRMTLGDASSTNLKGVIIILEREQGESWGCFVNNNASEVTGAWNDNYLPTGCVLEDQTHPIVGALGDD